MRIGYLFPILLMLLLVCAAVPPVQLVCDAAGTWKLERYVFKVPAWRWSSLRDFPVLVTRRADGYFSVAFDPEEHEREIGRAHV